MSNVLNWINALGSLATAIGVAIAAHQLSLQKKQTQSSFEDGLVRQYRDIVEHIPLEALIGRALSPDEVTKNLRWFYKYFDLTNEQIGLAGRGRIRIDTWAEWLQGIEQHMHRPAFRDAWRQLESDLEGSFDELIKDVSTITESPILPERRLALGRGASAVATISTPSPKERSCQRQPLLLNS